MSDPYKSPQSRLEDPPRQGLSWRAAFLGGAVAIAATAFFGTLESNITLWVLTQRGLSAQEAYGQLFDSTGQNFVSAIVNFLCNAVGGYTASSLASKRFVVHGISAGVISLLFVAVMYATPISYPSNAWTVAWLVLIPVPAAVLGGYLHAWRA
jgi:hypothetical protein